MDTAVVEFYPLPDPVRSAANNDNTGLCRRPHLGLGFIGRIIVGGISFEFSGTGIHELVNRYNPFLVAHITNLAFTDMPQP